MVDLYKRDRSPFWYYDLMVDGKRRRVSTKREKKAQAKAVAEAALKEALDRKQLGGRPEITLREALFDHYLPTRRGEGCKSLVNLQRYAEYLCGDRAGIAGLGEGGDTKLHTLTDSMLRSYRNQRLAAGMAVQSVDHEIKCVQAAVRMVTKDHLVAVGLAWPIARQKGKARYLTPDEEEALLADLDPARPLPTRGGGATQIAPLARMAKQRADNYDLAVMLLDTGCRFGEIARLTWMMVDTIEWEYVRIWRDKVDNGARLNATARMAAVLKRRYDARRNSPFVFPSWADNAKVVRTSTAAIRRAMNRIGLNEPDKVAEFGRRDCRSLRDTFASKLRTNGMALDRIQELLGHSSPEMTQKYAHLSVSRASQDAVAMLDKLNAQP